MISKVFSQNLVFYLLFYLFSVFQSLIVFYQAGFRIFRDFQNILREKM